MSIGDFDGDGRKDLIFGSQDQPHYTENLWLYRQNASGGLDAPREVRTAPFPEKSMAADMNGDGRDDLLVVHRDQTLGYYLQTANGLAPEAPYRTVQNSYYYGHGMAVGDIDSDGCKDVVLATRSDGIVVLRGSRCRVAGTPSDIHADGKSDLLWRDDGRQYLAIWRMNGSARVDGIGYAVPPDWRVLATGDFQGDRKLDVVWTNGVQMQLWEGDGNGGFIGTPMPNYPTGWRVVAAGDINGDGNADLLWRNDANTQAGLWVMRGAQVIDSAGYLTSANWWVAGSGDLNGDGRLDVIWTDGTQMQLWRAASGLGFAGEAMPGYPNGWELTATGDVTGDGMADLMWRHPELGHFAVWAMEGGARLYGQGYQPGPSWRVAQTGDFNGDGRTDVVWTNGGLMQLWQAQGDGFVGVEMPDYPVGWSVIRR
jgi:hypothetical protein